MWKEQIKNFKLQFVFLEKTVVLILKFALEALRKLFPLFMLIYSAHINCKHTVSHIYSFLRKFAFKWNVWGPFLRNSDSEDLGQVLGDLHFEKAH